MLLLMPLSIVTGAVTGTGGPLLDASTRTGVLGAVLVAGWCYASIPFCLGMAGASRWKAVISGTTALIVAVISYYSLKAVQGDFRTVDFSDTSGREFFSWSGFASMTLYWCVAALVLGPPLGVAGWMARHGAIRLPFRLVIPVIALAETAMRLRVEASTASSPAVMAWELVRATALALIVLLVGVAVWKRRHRHETSRPAPATSPRTSGSSHSGNPGER
ncbi:DUF6518 family protein [Streptomyces sp. NBC_00102]|uniref:DUF6518 family protein n=1 Tax=Streptomyces sp. NBC_00102 TaxID=2975652 RepID=UPI00225AE2A5|nr:DUF6518 family protein [Streptomyces sp. NBC_00102]